MEREFFAVTREQFFIRALVDPFGFAGCFSGGLLGVVGGLRSGCAGTHQFLK